MNRHTFAKWGVVILFPPNALLTAIFFFLLLGNLSAVFGNDWGFMASMAISLMLGVGLVIGETVAHLTNAENKEHSVGVYFILFLLAATNWGAGVYRSADNAREQSVAAISQSAKDDKRYQSLQSEKDHLQKNVLDDGIEKNDAKAMDRMKEINTEMESIEDKYASKANLLTVGGKWNLLISLAFIVINLVYGLCVKAAYDGSLSPPTGKRGQRTMLDRAYDATVMIDGETDKHKKGKLKPATAEYKPRIGFDPQDSGKKTPPLIAGTGEILSPGNGDKFKEMNQKSIESRTFSKEQRKRMLKSYLAANPHATLSEMASAIGVSSGGTVRKYLDEMGYRPSS